MSILESLFLKLAETSGLISLLLVPLLLLRPWLRRWVGSPWLCLLWLLVLGRLLLPLPVESRWSWSWSNYWPRQETPLALVTEPAKVRMSTLPAMNEASVATLNTGMASPVHRSFPVSRLLGAIWAVGFATGLAGLGLRIWKTRRLAALTCPVTDAWTLAIYESIPAGTRRNVQLRVTTALDIPTLAGVLRPQIWLPADWEHKLTPNEMRQVLLHELGHARRRDLLVQWLFAVAQCLHWFNPLVWIFARYARFDREMACDAWVLTQGGIGDPEHYGATLLKITRMLSNPLRSAPGGAAMATSKRDLTTRIAGIGAFCQRPAWCGVVGVGTVLAGLTVLTTRGVAVEESLTPVNYPISANSPAPSTSDAKADGAQIEIEAKFLELTESVFAELIAPGGILADAFTPASAEKGGAVENGRAILDAPKLEAFIRALNQKRGVDLLTSPRVSTKPRLRAKVEITEELRYATKFVSNKAVPPQFIPTHFETKNVGVALTVEPTIEADGKTITLHSIPEVIEFLGFKGVDGKELPKEESEANGAATQDLYPQPLKSIIFDPHKPQMPVFSEYRLDANFSLFSGQTAVLRLGTKSLSQKGQPSENRVLLVLVTARIVTALEVAEAKAEAARLEASGAPFAVVNPVDKEGFVYSPFAPDAGLIDVRGYDAGAEVKCPYTGKVFLVPPR